MEYLFIIVLQVIGCGLAGYFKIKSIDARCNNDTPRQVLTIFWNEEKLSLMIGQSLVLLLQLTVHGIIDYYDLPIRNSSITIPGIDLTLPYLVFSLAGALFLGWGGQRFVYMVFGKADEKATQIFGKKE